MKISVKNKKIAALAVACVACVGFGVMSVKSVSANAETEKTGKTVWVSGSSIYSEETKGATSVTLNLEMEYGASVRYEEGSTGIRFTTRILQDEYNALGESCANVKFGTLIAPYDKVDGSLTLESGEGNFVNIEQTEDVSWYRKKVGTDVVYYCFNGALTNIYSVNYDRDFIGVGYMTITYSDNTTETVYATPAAKEEGDTAESNVRNIKEMAQKLLANDASAAADDKLTAEQKNVLGTFSHDAVLKSDGTEATVAVGTKYAGKTVNLNLRLSAIGVEASGGCNIVSGKSSAAIENVSALNNTVVALSGVTADKNGKVTVKLNGATSEENYSIFADCGTVTEVSDNAVKADLSTLTYGTTANQQSYKGEYFGNIVKVDLAGVWNGHVHADFSAYKDQTATYPALRVTLRAKNSAGWAQLYVSRGSSGSGNPAFGPNVNDCVTSNEWVKTGSGLYIFDKDGNLVTGSKAKVGEWYTFVMNDVFKNVASQFDGNVYLYGENGKTGASVEYAEIAICENYVWDTQTVALSSVSVSYPVHGTKAVTVQDGEAEVLKINSYADKNVDNCGGHYANRNGLTFQFSSYADLTTNTAVKITFKMESDNYFKIWKNDDFNSAISFGLKNDSGVNGSNFYVFDEDGNRITSVSGLDKSKYYTVIINNFATTEKISFGIESGNTDAEAYIASISACKNYVPAK